MSAPQPPPPPPLLVRGADGGVRWSGATHDAASAPGGTHAGAVPGRDAAFASLPLWEREADAVYLLARARCGRWDVHASRRVMEAAPRAVQLRYYERWTFAVATLLVETGVLSSAELEARLAQQASRPARRAAPFADGARVRVLSAALAAAWRPQHSRTPGYAQGAVGVVERCAGDFAAPEEAALHCPPVRERLYRVAFAHDDLFPDAAAASGADTAVVEVFERWLVAADDAEQPVDAPAASVYEALLHAVKSLLIERGVLSQADIDAHVAAQAAAADAGAALGGRLVAAAWCDDAFRARLLTTPAAAAAELGISTAGIARLVVLSDTPDVHNLVVCSLCSCYPRPILGPPPAWYASWQYRARAVREPRAVLAELGVPLLPTQAVAVHDSTADCRYLVLPIRPAGTEGCDEAQLAALVTVPSLVGAGALLAHPQPAP